MPYINAILAINIPSCFPVLRCKAPKKSQLGAPHCQGCTGLILNTKNVNVYGCNLDTSEEQVKASTKRMAEVS